MPTTAWTAYEGEFSLSQMVPAEAPLCPGWSGSNIYDRKDGLEENRSLLEFQDLTSEFRLFKD